MSELSYRTAVEITDKAEAAAYFERMIQEALATTSIPREEAEKMQRANIGYFAGYYGAETQRRVEEFYGAIHPVFGSVAHSKVKTPQDAFDLGLKMGESSR